MSICVCHGYNMVMSAITKQTFTFCLYIFNLGSKIAKYVEDHFHLPSVPHHLSLSSKQNEA